MVNKINKEIEKLTKQLEANKKPWKTWHKVVNGIAFSFLILIIYIVFFSNSSKDVRFDYLDFKIYKENNRFISNTYYYINIEKPNEELLREISKKVVSSLQNDDLAYQCSQSNINCDVILINDKDILSILKKKQEDYYNYLNLKQTDRDKLILSGKNPRNPIVYPENELKDKIVADITIRVSGKELIGIPYLRIK